MENEAPSKGKFCQCTFIAETKKIQRIVDTANRNQIAVEDLMNSMINWFVGSPYMKYELNAIKKQRSLEAAETNGVAGN